jgi:hypothetical protein
VVVVVEQLEMLMEPQEQMELVAVAVADLLTALLALVEQEEMDW